MLLGLVNKINKRTLTNMTDMTEMNEYECIIYMMYSEKTHLRYIGATEQTLKVRLTLHRSMFKRWKEGKGRDYGSFRILEIDPEAVLIELERCSKDLKPLRENYWWNTTSDTTNILEPGAWAAAGGRAGYMKEYGKKYSTENKESIKAYLAKYRSENKDSIKAQTAKYRADNRDIINTKAREKITCECGSIISKRNVAAHRHTAKHLARLSNNNTQ
jgi:hypothetical protein